LLGNGACDFVHRDPGTGKNTILGTFSAFHARSFPTSLQFCVYFAITDGQGEQLIRLRVVQAREAFVGTQEAPPLAEFEMPMNFDNPLMIAEGRAHIRATIPEPGIYFCELYAGDSLLMSRRMLAIQMKGKAGDGEGG